VKTLPSEGRCKVVAGRYHLLDKLQGGSRQPSCRFMALRCIRPRPSGVRRPVLPVLPDISRAHRQPDPMDVGFVACRLENAGTSLGCIQLVRNFGVDLRICPAYTQPDSTLIEEKEHVRRIPPAREDNLFPNRSF
jgi:hypothetical protein